MGLLVTQNYDIGQVDVSGIREVDEWETLSNNFRVPVNDQGGTFEVVLHKNLRLRDGHIIGIVNRLLEYMYHEGIIVPRVYPTRTGEGLFEADGYYHRLFDFISGNHYRGTAGELSNIASNIARLHNVLLRVPFADEIEARPAVLPPWSMEDWAKLVEESKSGSGSNDVLFRDYQAFLIEQAQQAAALNTKGMRFQVVKGDFHPLDTIFENDRLKAFIDFDDTRFCEVAREVANACHRFVRQFVVFQEVKWEDALQYGLDVFIDRYLRLNPLSDREVTAFPSLIKDELLSKICRDLKRYYHRGEAQYLSGGEFEKRLTLLKEAELIGQRMP